MRGAMPKKPLSSALSHHLVTGTRASILMPKPRVFALSDGTGRMQGKGGTKSVCGLIQNERCREIDLPEVAARTLAATRRRNERTMRKAKCPTPMRPTLGVGYVQATRGGLGRAVWGKRCAHSLSWSPSRRRLSSAMRSRQMRRWEAFSRVCKVRSKRSPRSRRQPAPKRVCSARRDRPYNAIPIASARHADLPQGRIGTRSTRNEFAGNRLSRTNRARPVGKLVWPFATTLHSKILRFLPYHVTILE